MVYRSVDQLQKVLADQIFHYAKDAKKAAGRALGTFVEIITFYLLRSWGFEHSVAIERALAEYGNAEITHNVEYSLHPIVRKYELLLYPPRLPVTASRILYELRAHGVPLAEFQRSVRTLLTTGAILRNSCIVANGSKSHLVATLNSKQPDGLQITVSEQYFKPYAMFECKRVGVEGGTKRGPPTIE